MVIWFSAPLVLGAALILAGLAARRVREEIAIRRYTRSRRP